MDVSLEPPQSSAFVLSVMYVVRLNDGTYRGAKALGPGVAIMYLTPGSVEIDYSNTLFVPVDPLSAVTWGWVTLDQVDLPVEFRTLFTILQRGGHPT